MDEMLFLAGFGQRWEAERSNPCKRTLVTRRLRLLFFLGVLVMDKKQLQPGDLSALPHTTTTFTVLLYLSNNPLDKSKKG